MQPYYLWSGHKDQPYIPVSTSILVITLPNTDTGFQKKIEKKYNEYVKKALLLFFCPLLYNDVNEPLNQYDYGTIGVSLAYILSMSDAYSDVSGLDFCYGNCSISDNIGHLIMMSLLCNLPYYTNLK